MTVLSLNEEDRALLVLLSPAQAGAVLQSLLIEGGVEMDDAARAAYESISKRVHKRSGGAERWRRWNDKKRLSNGLPNSLSNSLTNAQTNTPPSPASPPVSPLVPPSPSPPTPPVFSPPYNPPSTTPSPTPASSARDARACAYSPAFEALWKVYPRKIGKQAAWRAFQRVKVPLETLVDAVERQKCSAQWREQNGRFIPHLATWLNQGRWEDEVEGTAGNWPGQGRSSTNQFLDLLEKVRKQ